MGSNTAVKERPINQRDWQVRAIHDGRRTQLRVPIKHPKSMPHYIPLEHIDGTIGAFFSSREKIETGIEVYKCWCPLGKVGDRLWVRETWIPLWDSGAGFFTCLCPTGHENDHDIIKYRADGEKPSNFAASWRPSSRMPREACRLLLEITDVRVSRLNDISEADAIAEGAPGEKMLECSEGCRHLDIEGDHLKQWDDGTDLGFLCPKCPQKLWHVPLDECHRAGFRYLWESIHGAGSWNENPWLWAISFKRLEPSHA